MKGLVIGVALALCAIQAHAQSYGTDRKIQICGMWSEAAVDLAKLRVANALDQHEKFVDPMGHTPPFYGYARAQLYEQTIYLPEQAWGLTVAPCTDRLDDLARDIATRSSTVASAGTGRFPSH